VGPNCRVCPKHTDLPRCSPDSLRPVRFILGPRFGLLAESHFRRQLATALAALIGIVAVILTLPISATLRAQLIAFLGLVLSAAIALSSTTFIGNVMAGFMIRAVGHFRPGDFVLVGEHFGRVSEQGLFTTEVQTQDRDLTTFPNLFLVTNPMTVVRSSGAIVSATVSLGYDIAHSIVERVLAQAVDRAELAEPFVQILDLGNYSVNYRVGGFLSDVKTLLTARSRLRASILDTLHENNVEIVSPTFMNQRALPAGRVFIPEKEVAPQRPAVPVPSRSPSTRPSRQKRCPGCKQNTSSSGRRSKSGRNSKARPKPMKSAPALKPR
jgi:small conductance mechanosensitive channel